MPRPGSGCSATSPSTRRGAERKSETGLGDDGAFYLVSGRFQFDDDTRRNDFLESLGALLVFLIDWNKARKVLREWVSKTDAVHALSWAALHRVGHRAFLELGGSELVASAVHHATPTRIGFGERLDRTLGRDAAIDFLKIVMRVSAEALLQGGSVRLARDRIEAALVAHLQGVDRALLAIVTSTGWPGTRDRIGHFAFHMQPASPSLFRQCGAG